MTTYQEYAAQFANHLVPAKSAVHPSEMLPGLQTLINALPYYGDPDFQMAHRGTLMNMVESNLPNKDIATPPPHIGLGIYYGYEYDGTYTGYNDAFYGSPAQTEAAQILILNVMMASPTLPSDWLTKCAVMTLTDAISQKTGGGSLNKRKLAADLASSHAALLPVLATTYYSVFMHGFAPTANAYKDLDKANQTGLVHTQLVALILAGQFTANINQAIAMGGDSTNAAVWFLFNLWVTLAALGSTGVLMSGTELKKVDEVIKKVSPKLTVPGEVGPESWWNGGYTSWYLPLSGADVSAAAKSMITEEMPVKGVIGGRANSKIIKNTVPNGYSVSLTEWSELNWYKA